jgi:hypothetical protein
MKLSPCCTALALVCLSGVTHASEMDYTKLLDELWAKTDADESGDLNQAEFSSALANLGLPASTFTRHGGSYTQLFTAVDTGNGAITQEELANAAVDMEYYRDDFIGAFTNGALEPPSMEMMETPDDVKSSRAQVTFSATVAGPPDAIYAGERAAMKSYFATTASVDEKAVVITFKPVDRRRLAAASKRELQATATDIDTTIFVKDAAAAESVSALLPSTTGDLEAIPAFSTVDVTSITPAEPYSVPPLPLATVGIIGAILVVAMILLIVNANYWSKKTAAKNGRKGGCCSLNAVGPWTFGESFASVVLIACVFYLYNNVTGVTDALIGLLEFLMAIVDAMDNPALASISGIIPAALMDQLGEGTELLEQAKSQFSLLPVAVMIPGLFAAIFLALGAMCPRLPINKGSLCWSKCYMFLALIFLIVALVFYILFAAAAIAFAFAPPELQEGIATIRGMCVSIPAQIGQQVTDGQLTLERLGGASNPDLAEIITTLDEAKALSDLVVDGCGSLISLIDELIGIFVPAIMCVIAIIFAAFVNETLCFAAGCCCYGPSKPGKSQVVKTQPDDNLQSV